MARTVAPLTEGTGALSASGAGPFVLPLPQLTRSFGQRAARLAWLFGAGASVMSGLPSAGDLMRQFRHLIYCTETNQPTEDVDERDPRAQDRIAAWFRERSHLPQSGDDDEYAALFELAYPSEADRAARIRTLVAPGRPNYGHHVLAALMAVDRVRVVWTTNFDDLPEQAARSLLDSTLVQPRRPLVVADLGDPEPAIRALRDESWPLVGKLHGDFISDRLKNTNAELQAQDERMRRAMLESCRRFGLVVVGYSGRDASVMNTLMEALDAPSPFPGGLCWCHRPDTAPAAVVLDLLSLAHQRGVDAYTVAADNFIELMAALENATTLPAPIRNWLSERRPPRQGVLDPAPPRGERNAWPVLRLNALPVLKLPTEAMVLRGTAQEGQTRTEVRFPEPRIDDVLTALRRSHARGLVAARHGGQYVALGDVESIRAAVADLGLSITEERVSLSLGAATDEVDMADLGLAHDALTLALGRTAALRPVLRANRDHLVRVDEPDHAILDVLRAAAGGDLAGTIPATGLRWAEAVSISLDRREGNWWLVVSPDIWVAPRPDNAGEVDPTPSDLVERRRHVHEFIRSRTATRYNRITSALLDAWIRLLTAGGNRQVRAWNLQPSAGIDAVFVLGGTTAWSRPLPVSDVPEQR